MREKLLSYEGDLYTETTDIQATKMLLNSVLSTEGARFMTIDIKIFYLGTPMDIYEYMKIRLDMIPEEIRRKYKLNEKQHNGYVYIDMK